MQSYELCCDMIDVVIDVSCIYGVREDQESAAFDEQSSSLIKLNNGTVLYLREVNKYLALVCILREDNFDHKGRFIELLLILLCFGFFLRYHRLQFSMLPQCYSTGFRVEKQIAVCFHDKFSW